MKAQGKVYEASQLFAVEAGKLYQKAGCQSAVADECISDTKSLVQKGCSDCGLNLAVAPTAMSFSQWTGMALAEQEPVAVQAENPQQLESKEEQKPVFSLPQMSPQLLMETFKSKMPVMPA